MMKPPSGKRPPSNFKQAIKEQAPRRFTSTQKQPNNNSSKELQSTKYKKPVDALSYANDIIQKANMEQRGGKQPDTSNPQKRNFHYQRLEKQGSFTKHQQGTYQIPKKTQPQQPPPPKQQKQKPQTPNTQLLAILTKHQQIQAQLLQKVDSLQQQIHQMKLADKKNAALLKQHKNCPKQMKKLTQIIKEQQLQFIKHVSDPKVPYTHKRQTILQSHIQKLKQYNKDLTLRLKAYKGTEVEYVANAGVKVYVLNQYEKDKEIDYGMEKLALESMAFKINKQLEGYLTKKVKKTITFADQQKYVAQLLNLLNQFGFQCLLQGLKAPIGDINIQDINKNFKERVEAQREYPPLNDQYNKIVKHSAFNLSVIQQANEVIDNAQPLFSKLAKPSSLIFDAFRSSKKTQEIEQKLEETIGVHMKVLKNTNSVLLSLLATTLGRYDILRNYVDNLSRGLGKKLKQIIAPLQDLQNLYEYRGGKDEVFKEKLLVFVNANIGKLCLKIPELEKQMEEVSIKFTKLVNYTM